MSILDKVFVFLVMKRDIKSGCSSVVMVYATAKDAHSYRDRRESSTNLKDFQYYISVMEVL